MNDDTYVWVDSHPPGYGPSPFLVLLSVLILILYALREISQQ